MPEKTQHDESDFVQNGSDFTSMPKFHIGEVVKPKPGSFGVSPFDLFTVVDFLPAGVVKLRDVIGHTEGTSTIGNVLGIEKATAEDIRNYANHKIRMAALIREENAAIKAKEDA